MGLDYLALFFLLVAQKRKTQLQQSVFTYNLWDVTKILVMLVLLDFAYNFCEFWLFSFLATEENEEKREIREMIFKKREKSRS